MSRWSVLVSVVVVLVGGQAAVGQTAVVENLYVPTISENFDIVGPTGGYIDIPITARWGHLR